MLRKRKHHHIQVPLSGQRKRHGVEEDFWIDEGEMSKESLISKYKRYNKDDNEKDQLKSVYFWAFDFCLKNLQPLSSPITVYKRIPRQWFLAIWSSLMPKDNIHVDQITFFLQDDDSKYPLNKDQYKSLFDFAMTILPDLSNYNPGQSCKSVLLDIYIYLKGRRANNL